MKRISKPGSMVVIVTAMIFALGGSVMAFHDAAKLQCNKCHTMHYSENGGDPIMPITSGELDLTEGGPNKHLLYYESITDLCLACHSGPTGAVVDSETAWSVWGRTTPGDTPGGDFDNSTGAVGATGKGHNPYYTGTDIESEVIDPDEVTGKELTPPGNSSQALAKWTCTSCHSPHGGENECVPYRNLRKMVNRGDGTATYDVDVSGTIGSGNGDEAALSTAYGSSNHNVYRNGAETSQATKFGAWCGACHGTFHGDETNTDIQDTDGDWIRHPTAYDIGGIGSPMAGNYGAAYDPDVPLVAGPGDSWTTGSGNTVDGNEDVFCLSCHQTHATANANIMRWTSDEGPGDNARCNKCHKKGYSTPP